MKNYNKAVYNLKELLLITLRWDGAALLFVLLKTIDLPQSYITQQYHLQNWVFGMRIYLVAFMLSWLVSIPMGLMH